MKKSLLALAALSTLASAVQAQSVTLYGRVGGEMKTNDAATSVTVMDGAATALGTSVFGVRGSEDLGGGLTANFNLEGALATADGTLGSSATTGQAFNRQSWVGLSSKNLGTIKIGRTETATKKIEGVGDLGTNIFDLGAAVDTYTDRFGSTVSYETPSFAGLTAEFTNTNSRDAAAAVATTTATVGAPMDAGLEINAFNVQYKAGKLALSAGQAQAKAADGFKAKNTLVGATYDAGFAKFEAAYQDEEASSTLKHKLMQFGAIVPINAKFDVRVNYSDLDMDNATATDFQYTGILAVYHLSKRTQAFAGYRKDAAGTGGTDNTFTSVGLNHSF